MKTNYAPKNIYKGLFLILLLTATTFIINSCKKNIATAPITDSKVLQAKAWYESTFPVAVNSKNNQLITQAVGTVSTIDLDYTQLFAPYWDKYADYVRDTKEVVEVPIEPSAAFATALSNMPGSGAVYKKEYSRTSFLIINDGQKTAAYIMTVIADSSYVKNDLTKLDHNKYNKRDADFSGVVLYHTPKGRFIKGWFYKNGNIMYSINPNNETTTIVNGQKQQVQNLKTNTITQNCTFWYQTVYSGGTAYTSFLDSYCITIDDGVAAAALILRILEEVATTLAAVVAEAVPVDQEILVSHLLKSQQLLQSIFIIPLKMIAYIVWLIPSSLKECQQLLIA
jgi:hypothetical protein